MTDQTLNFQCPACKATLAVPSSMAGVRGPCPHCRSEISAPMVPAQELNANVASPQTVPPTPQPVSAAVGVEGNGMGANGPGEAAQASAIAPAVRPQPTSAINNPEGNAFLNSLPSTQPFQDQAADLVSQNGGGWENNHGNLPHVTPTYSNGPSTAGFSTGQIPAPGSSTGGSALPQQPSQIPQNSPSGGEEASPASIWNSGTRQTGSLTKTGILGGQNGTNQPATEHAPWAPVSQPVGQGSGTPPNQDASGSSSLFFEQSATSTDQHSAPPQQMPQAAAVAGAQSMEQPTSFSTTELGKDGFGGVSMKTAVTSDPPKRAGAKRLNVGQKKQAKSRSGLFGIAAILALLLGIGGAYYTWPQWKETKFGKTVSSYLNPRENRPEKPEEEGPRVEVRRPGSVPASTEETVPESVRPTGAVVDTGTELEPGAPVATGTNDTPVLNSGDTSSRGASVISASPAASSTPRVGTPDQITPPTSSGSEIQPLIEVPTVANDAAEALTKFLAAENWQERLKYCQIPDKVKGLMSGYYSTNAADGPVAIRTLRFQDRQKAPGVPYYFYIFNVSTTDMPQEFPVSVEETSDGFRVDWRTFIEFKDALLVKYVAAPRPEPGVFYVRMERAHYFEDNVPDLDSKDCFLISAPMPGHKAYAFLAKDSPLAKTLSQQVRWNDTMYAVVQIQWVAREGGEPYLELVSVPQYNWRSDGGGGSNDGT